MGFPIDNFINKKEKENEILRETYWRCPSMGVTCSGYDEYCLRDKTKPGCFRQRRENEQVILWLKELKKYRKIKNFFNELMKGKD